MLGPFRLALDGGFWGLFRGRGPDSGPRLLQRRGHLATGVGVFVSTGFACLCVRGLCVCVYGICVVGGCVFVCMGLVSRSRSDSFLLGETAPDPVPTQIYQVKRPGGRSDSYFTG